MVIGLGRFGQAIAESLYNAGEDVLAVDVDPELVAEMEHRATYAAQADTTEKQALIALSAGEFDTAIVTIGTDIKSSGITVMLLKELGVKTVVAKAFDELHGRMLMRLGADKVVFPERDMGRRVAHNLLSNNILDFIEISPDFSLAEIAPPAEWRGQTIGELSLRARYDINVVAILREGVVNGNIRPDTRIADGDVMLVMAGSETIQKFPKAH